MDGFWKITRTAQHGIILRLRYREPVSLKGNYSEAELAATVTGFILPAKRNKNTKKREREDDDEEKNGVHGS